MGWELEYTDAALIDWHLTPVEIQERIQRALLRLIHSEDPRQDHFVEPLYWQLGGFYKLKFWNYRVIFRMLIKDQMPYLQIWDDFILTPVMQPRVLEIVRISNRNIVYTDIPGLKETI